MGKSNNDNTNNKDTKVKAVLKAIVSKLPIFIFCVVFLAVYNNFFDASNSIAGVMLLSGVLMFLNADFGYDAKYSAVIIPLLYIVMGVLAKISCMSIWFSVPCTVVMFSVVLLLTRNDKNNICFLPFLMGYIMLRGYDVAGELFIKRMISLAVLGSVCGILHYALNHKRDSGIKPMLGTFSLANDWEKWSLSLVVTISLVMLVGDLTSITKSMWVNLAVFSLMNPIAENRSSRRKTRVPATILGSVAFLVLFGYLVPQQYQTIVVMFVGFASMLFSNYFIKTAFNTFNALFTAAVLLPTKEAVLVRIINNIAGTVAAIVALAIFALIFKNFSDKNENELA